jgi:uncharacterized repeat protein (TIGR02543 family)
MKSKIFTLLCVLLTFFSLSYSQDQCAPVGWCTQNGGTTGGGSASPVTVNNISNLTTQANGSGSRVIYVSGTLGSNTRVRVSANTTIIGLPGAKLVGGFDVRGNNVIIRNMIVQGPGAVDVNGVDCINIDGASTTNVWIDHCDIYDGQDGNLDITNGASFITVSWTKFHYTSASSNHQFCNLIGNSDSKTSDRGRLKVTMMYNWWTTGTVERMPRVRFGQVHVVNNLFDSPQADYCVRAGIEADILVEGNYFDAVNEPINLFENDFTAITARNNVFNNTTGNTAGSGTSFSPPYSLNIAPAANVKALVSASCGAGATLPSPTQCGCGTSQQYTLTTTANPSAGGSITRSPNATSYAPGTVVTLTATPASGYTFTGWSGGASGTNTTTTVTMNANTSVTANFTNGTSTYTLTTTVNPAAGGSIARSPNATTYAAGTVVTLTATPASGYSFNSWSGGASGTSSTTTVTMNANTTVTANFTTSGGGTTVRIDDKSGTGIGYCSANGSRQNTYTGADGGYYINLSNSSGQGITWATSAGSAGTYNIRWRYSNAGTQSATTARVLVNGVQVVASAAFPKTATWSTWTTTAWIPVTLVAGANKIRLETTVSSEFAMIDWIEISGNNPTEASCSAGTGTRMATEALVTGINLQEIAPMVVPNPSTGFSTLRFGVADWQKVMVNLYAADGRLVKTIINKTYAPGTYTLPVDYTGLNKGVYFIIIDNGSKRTVLQNMFAR